MTNGEKFKEVFGFKPNRDFCPIPFKICKEHECDNDCEFSDWFNKEYKECFALKEEFEDD